MCVNDGLGEANNNCLCALLASHWSTTHASFLGAINHTSQVFPSRANTPAPYCHCHCFLWILLLCSISIIIIFPPIYSLWSPRCPLPTALSHFFACSFLNNLWHCLQSYKPVLFMMRCLLCWLQQHFVSMVWRAPGLECIWGLLQLFWQISTGGNIKLQKMSMVIQRTTLPESIRFFPKHSKSKYVPGYHQMKGQSLVNSLSMHFHKKATEMLTFKRIYEFL